MSRHPEVKWAEREDKVFLTVMLPDAKNPKVNLGPEGTFTFSATGGAGDLEYELKLDLCDRVNVEESKINYGVRSIFCVLEKEEKKWWNKLLKEGKPPHYVKVDWDKWADEDDDTSAAEPDLGGMDFSKFGDMGGMGGMGGMEGLMGGMGGMGGMEGLMGGMGGMGGMMGMEGLMGGMGGMGGPEEFEDDSDDDELEASKPEEAKTDDKPAAVEKTEAA